MSPKNPAADEFLRLHKMFLFHLGCAATLAWVAAIYAAFSAPWVRNIRALIDPSGPFQVESTGSFLFGLPVIMTIGWAAAFFGADLMRQARMLRSQSTEFALAGAAAFTVFCMAVNRAVAVLLIAA